MNAVIDDNHDDDTVMSNDGDDIDTASHSSDSDSNISVAVVNEHDDDIGIRTAAGYQEDGQRKNVS